MSENNTEAESHYLGVCKKFDLLISYGMSVSNALSGKPVENVQQDYGIPIFSKMLCHAITLRRISPTGIKPKKGAGREIWDVSSACAISRAILEAYDALAYIAIEGVSDSERQFRVLLWELHAYERREKMLNLIGSTAPELEHIKSQVLDCRDKVTSHEWFELVDLNVKKKVKEFNAPATHLSQRVLNERNNVNLNYYNSTQMFLSAYVHTYPFSTQQLMNFRAGDPECLRLYSLPIQYACIFLARALDGMRVVFKGQVPDAEGETLDAVERWSRILKDGVSLPQQKAT